MTLSKLQRMGGLSLIAGAFLFTVWSICWTILLPVSERYSDFSLMVLSPHWIWIATVAFVGIILTIFGFIAVYSRIYNEMGTVSFTGFVSIMIAYILQAGQLTWEVFLYPAIAANASSIAALRDRSLLSHPIVQSFRWTFDVFMLVGVILFSIALIRSRHFAKPGGILFLAGIVLYAIGPFISIFIGIAGVVIFSIGCILIGKGLCRKAA